MTEKFDQFISGVFTGLVEKDGGDEQSPEEVAVVTNVGKRQNQKSMIKKMLSAGPEKRAGEAVKKREKAQKAKLPKMLDKYETETAGIMATT